MSNKMIDTLHKKYKIDIIGAGAIGMLWAARLKEAGHYVRLWCRTSEQATILAQEGFLFEEMISPLYNVNIKLDEVYVFSEKNMTSINPTQSDFTFITIKQSGFDASFLSTLQAFHIASQTGLYICLQNGIGHIDTLSSVIDASLIVQAVTSEAALRTSKGIQHTGYGVTQLSDQLGREMSANIVEQCLNEAGIRCLVSKSIQEHVYNKLIVNAVINPLTALYRLPNGQLPLHPARLQLMEQLYKETKHIIESTLALHLHITFDEIVAICHKTAQNHSSMYADVLHGRKTEIEAINGAIVKLATTHHMQAPINETLYLLVLAQHP